MPKTKKVAIPVKRTAANSGHPVKKTRVRTARSAKKTAKKDTGGVNAGGVIDQKLVAAKDTTGRAVITGGPGRF